MKKLMLGFIMGILLCSGIVYATNLYKSEDIFYEPSDASWEVDNVSAAINSLHNNTIVGDATSSDILSGKTALVQGELVTGTLTVNNGYGVLKIYTKNGMTEGSSFSYDLDNTSIPSSTLNNITKNNFLIVPSQVYVSGSSTGYVQTWVDITYNTSSHVVTYALNGIRASNGNYSYSQNINLYVYYPL